MLRSQSPAADVPNTHFLNRRDRHYPARRGSVHPDRIPDGITGIRIVSDTHIRIADFRIQRPVQPIGMHLGTPTLRFGITVVNFTIGRIAKIQPIVQKGIARAQENSPQDIRRNKKYESCPHGMQKPAKLFHNDYSRRREPSEITTSYTLGSWPYFSLNLFFAVAMKLS